MSLANKKGVDISSNNGAIDMGKIKAAGYDFVMIRCGFGSDISSQDDSQFENNVKKAEAIGLPWGAYHYSYALNISQAKSEVEHIKRLLKGKKPTLPIALDMEDADGYHARNGAWNSQIINTVTKTILDGIRAAGYYPMLYTGFEELENLISADVANNVDIWFAHWARKCGYTGSNLSMWQYGGETNLLESNSIAGVGVIDKNICYKDYPTIIKNGGYNGWEKGSASKPDESKPKSTTDIKDVQKWLNSAINSKLTLDGVYGPLTKKSLIKALQTILNNLYHARLVVDGIYGSATNAAIHNLKKGDKNDCVQVLQGFLICNGYNTGGFDGIFGDKTDSAVKAYQKVKKLYVDGIAGRATFSSLAGGD